MASPQCHLPRGIEYVCLTHCQLHDMFISLRLSTIWWSHVEISDKKSPGSASWHDGMFALTLICLVTKLTREIGPTKTFKRAITRWVKISGLGLDVHLPRICPDTKCSYVNILDRDIVRKILPNWAPRPQKGSGSPSMNLTNFQTRSRS